MTETSPDYDPGHQLAPAEPRPVALLPSETETQRLHRAAVMLAGTDFVPGSLRGKPEAIMAAMLTGREMGIHPMRSLRQIAIVDGRPAPSPELMMALALKAGHHVRVTETDHEHCTVVVRRDEWPEHDPPSTLTWTIDDAVRAGLCTLGDDGRPRARSRNGQPLPWEAYTRAMLRSRAVTEACRAWLPDVVEGYSYAPEELGAEVNRDGHAVELIHTAGARDETYDPLDGEPDPVRQAVHAAMDPDDAVDAEVVDETAGEEPADVSGHTAGEPSDAGQGNPGEGRDATSSAASSGPARDSDEGDVQPAHPEPQPEVEPDVSFDWRAHADTRQVTTVALLKTLRESWPTNDQHRRPDNSRQIDRLAADPDMAPVVKATIDDLAEGS